MLTLGMIPYKLKPVSREIIDLKSNLGRTPFQWRQRMDMRLLCGC